MSKPIEDVINSEYNNISVWDVTFYRLDDDGNPLEDKNGKTIIYTSYKVDCSYLAEGLKVEDLVPEDKPNPGGQTCSMCGGSGHEQNTKNR